MRNKVFFHNSCYIQFSYIIIENDASTHFEAHFWIHSKQTVPLEIKTDQITKLLTPKHQFILEKNNFMSANS